MKKVAKKLETVIKKKGFAQAIKMSLSFLYKKTIRKVMPKNGYLSTKNGIPTDERLKKLGDDILPDSFSPSGYSNPHYEYALCKNIRKFVKEEDNILIVGGGEGVTTAAAAKKSGKNGNVIVYEASKKMVKRIKKVASINNIEERVDVREGVVGKKISVRGGEPSKDKIEPEKLPECDVLELDCEGAELDILNQMEISPHVILVETHGMYGSSTKKVKSILEKKGYEVLSTETAVIPNSPVSRPDNFCKDNDIMVISAEKT